MFNSQLCQKLPLWPWTSHLISLYLWNGNNTPSFRIGVGNFWPTGNMCFIRVSCKMVYLLGVHRHRTLQLPADVVQHSQPMGAVGSGGLGCRFPTAAVERQGGWDIILYWTNFCWQKREAFEFTQSSSSAINKFESLSLSPAEDGLIKNITSLCQTILLHSAILQDCNKFCTKYVL